MSEKDNKHDLYAVALVKRIQSDQTADSCQMVGHVPLELSRHLFFAMKHGCNLTAEVIEKKPHRSNLTQGGLEILTLQNIVYIQG